MPDCASGEPKWFWRQVRVWSDLSRWERKQFHQENESRVRRGLSPLAKP